VLSVPAAVGAAVGLAAAPAATRETSPMGRKTTRVAPPSRTGTSGTPKMEEEDSSLLWVLTREEEGARFGRLGRSLLQMEGFSSLLFSFFFYSLRCSFSFSCFA
jgi:hypothetical protein